MTYIRRACVYSKNKGDTEEKKTHTDLNLLTAVN